MSYSAVFEQSAIDMMNKLDRTTRVRLYKWIAKNIDGVDDPRTKGKAMVGDRKGYWRYRVGDYRLIVRIIDQKVTICVVAVGHRRDIYKSK